MPRKARIYLCGVASAKTYVSGALQHIIVRAINRRKIFFDDSDRDGFLGRLGAIRSDSKTPCFAWAFETNHRCEGPANRRKARVEAFNRGYWIIRESEERTFFHQSTKTILNIFYTTKFILRLNYDTENIP